MKVKKVHDLAHWKLKYQEATEKGGVRKETNKGWMYISTPKEIEEFIRKRAVKGKLLTTKIIAEYLTKKHKVDFTCPLTTGIFFSIAANVAEKERTEEGKVRVMPYWRVIKQDGRLYEKYLGEYLPQKELLENDGYKLEKDKQNKMEKVVNWQDSLVRI